MRPALVQFGLGASRLGPVLAGGGHWNNELDWSRRRPGDAEDAGRTKAAAARLNGAKGGRHANAPRLEKLRFGPTILV